VSGNPIIQLLISISIYKSSVFQLCSFFSQFSFYAFKGNSFVVLQWTSHLGCLLLDFEVHSLMELEFTSQPQIHFRLVTIAAAAVVLKQSTAADPKQPAIVMRPTAAIPACHDAACGFCCAMAPHDWELCPGFLDCMPGLQ
jgi:hypothetical protein